jgi:3'-phosphoadenosine 5'-phosphosulfate sulfotransferase (PAPS reductase)/FAD synthetase
MERLSALEAKSVFILREAYNRIEPLIMLWSLGKDSNVMAWLARKAFALAARKRSNARRQAVEWAPVEGR